MSWLKTVKIFESVIQHRSLSAAGRNLGLSPASVSRHISALENDLGVRLLNRTSRRLSLTEAGQLYFEKIEAILVQIEETDRSVKQLHNAPKGVLRLHSRMLIGQQYIAPAMKKFLTKYPEIKVDLRLSNFPVDIVADGVDIDIRMGKMADSSLVASKLANSERLLCASPEYLAKCAPLETPNDLAQHSCLTYRLDLGIPVWRFRIDGENDFEIAVDGCFKSDSGDAILTAAKAGLGIAMMNDWSVREELADGRLVRIFQDFSVSFSEFDNGVYAVFQKSQHLPKKIRLFVDFLKTELKNQLS